MNELPAAGSGGEPAKAAGAFSRTRFLIYAGAAGTVILALSGVGVVLGRLSQRGAMAELVVIIPLWVLVGAWMLSPYWGALRLERRGSMTTGEGVLIAGAVVMLIALAANSFLVTPAFVGGKPHPTADGVTIVLIPMAQWVVVGGAGLLLRLGRAVRRRGHAA